MTAELLPTWLFAALVAIYGLVVGSFLNVVIYRLPRELSLARPRSHCPACGKPVRWYDNVPLISWLALGGRCRACRARISIRYPLVEVGASALAVGALLRFGVSVAGLEMLVLAWLLLPLALIDLEHHLLPDVMTLPGIAVGLVCSTVGGLVGWREALVGAIAGGALPYLVIVVYRRLRGVEGMGLGDVKLLAMVGAFLGWRGMLATLGLGSAAGAIVGLGLIAVARARRDTELPCGTFLAAAAALVAFAGPGLFRLLVWVSP
jgi:leader peptidase (prepilin peptidase) / N-methyltransferase